MTEELRATRQGPPRSGEVVITESEFRNDPSFDEELVYVRIARHFFNQFLELKIAVEEGRLAKPDYYDREMRQQRKAAEQFKKAAQDLAEENGRMEEALALAEDEKAALREQVNSLTIQLGHLSEKLEGLGIVKREAQKVGYKFTEHMSEESRRAFEQLMTEIPKGH